MKNANKVIIVMALAASIAASSHIFAGVYFVHTAYAQPINPGAQSGLSPLEPPRVPANGERLPDDQPHQHQDHDSGTTDNQADSIDNHHGTGHSSDSNANDNGDKSTIATASITHDSHNLDQHTAATDNAKGDGTQQPYTGIVPSNK